MQHRGLAVFTLAVVVSMAYLSSLTITRMVRDSDELASAGTDGPAAQKPAVIATATPSGRPDTSKPSWARPFLDEESAKPRYERMIGPIRLAPGGRATSGPIECSLESAIEAPIAVGQSSPLAIVPAFLPPGAAIDPAMEVAARCGEVVVNVERTYVIPPEPDAERRVRSGEVNWFDFEHGGYIWIWRTLVPGPQYFGTEIPSAQWSEVQVAGFPGAVGKPTLDGLGHATVVTWDADTGILTVIRGLDRRADELLRVAEGAVR